MNPSMKWVFMESRVDDFLTCDNPVYLGIGIKPPDGELSFPLSSDLALFASWKLAADGVFCVAETQIVNEFNRRTIVSASHHVYYKKDANWARSLVKKGHLRLNRINLNLKASQG